jgi:hypothetical protein
MIAVLAMGYIPISIPTGLPLKNGENGIYSLQNYCFVET